MHNITGGVCTGWKRQGYTFDGAMHWLVGTKPGSTFYNIWEELGATRNWQIVDHDLFVIAEKGGRTLNFYSDIDRLKKHMLEIAPEDSGVIREFTGAVRKLSRVEMPYEKAPELYNIIDMLKMVGALPSLMLVRKWSKVTSRDFFQRFKNPFLREVLTATFVGDSADVPLLFFLYTCAWLDQKMAGYVKGGSLELVKSIEKRYLELGGELRVSSRVEKILVENDTAVGIRTADGQEHRSDIVISAADGHATLFGMLEGKYLDRKTRGYYENPQLFPPLIYVSLGVARSFGDIPPSVTGLNIPLTEPIMVAGKPNRWMGVQIYNFDPAMAPPGKTAMKTQFMTDYEYWRKLRLEPERYKQEKEQIARQVIAQLDQRFPGLAGQVQTWDVATPVTWERYTGNWRGSYEGWLFKHWDMNTRISKTLPGLKGFYMAGQWVEPGGGMPTAVMSGRNVTQIICRKDKKRFVTIKP